MKYTYEDFVLEGTPEEIAEYIDLREVKMAKRSEMEMRNQQRLQNNQYNNVGAVDGYNQHLKV